VPLFHPIWGSDEADDMDESVTDAHVLRRIPTLDRATAIGSSLAERVEGELGGKRHF